MIVHSQIRRTDFKSVQHHDTTQRGGATVLETAFVLAIFALFMFGVLEYGRFIFISQVVENAAREGGRYAVVHTQDATLVADTQTRVNERMANVQQIVRNYNVQVYKADSAGNNSGTPDTAAFGEYIAVQIDCDYDPILPSFLFMNNTIPIQAKILMNSEAN